MCWGGCEVVFVVVLCLFFGNFVLVFCVVCVVLLLLGFCCLLL